MIFNATFTTLAWGLPSDAQYLQAFVVEVRNGSWRLFNETQLIIETPDPCDRNEAIVTATYKLPNQSCNGISSNIILGSEFMQKCIKHASAFKTLIRKTLRKAWQYQ